MSPWTTFTWPVKVATLSLSLIFSESLSIWIGLSLEIARPLIVFGARGVRGRRAGGPETSAIAAASRQPVASPETALALSSAEGMVTWPFLRAPV